MLKNGSILDAALIAAPNSKKTAEGERDNKLREPSRESQRQFGMGTQAEMDSENGLVHTGTMVPASEADVVQVADLLHGNDGDAYSDYGYHGAASRVWRYEL